MKKKAALPLMAVKLIFVLSVVTALFCVYQILSSPLKQKNTLEEWRSQLAAGTETAIVNHLEDPIPTDGIKLPPDIQPSAGMPLQKGVAWGELHIPKLKLRAALLEGTEASELARGVGHYIGSGIPGTGGNSVLAGHRDTVFRNLGKLAKGDTLEVTTKEGTFVYVVTGSKITGSKELVTIQETDASTLTLITCYPFTYIGPAPDRYILTAEMQQ
jgi:sortase A